MFPNFGVPRLSVRGLTVRFDAFTAVSDVGFDLHDVFERPQETYTRSLLSAVPRLGSMTGESGPRRFELLDTGGFGDPEPVAATTSDPVVDA